MTYCVCESHSVVSDSSQPHGLKPTRLLCPRNSLDQNTGVGCRFLLQGILLTQGWTPASSIAGRFLPSEPLGMVGGDSVASKVSLGCFPSDFTYWVVLKLFLLSSEATVPCFLPLCFPPGGGGTSIPRAGVTSLQRKAPEGRPPPPQASAGPFPAAVRTQGHAGHWSLFATSSGDCVFNLRCTCVLCVTRIISLQSRGDHVTVR